MQLIDVKTDGQELNLPAIELLIIIG